VQPAWADKRVALVIGNSAYRHVPPLRNPGNDAADMRAKLAALGFQLFGGADLDRAAMLRSLTDFGRAAETADVALVFRGRKAALIVPSRAKTRRKSLKPTRQAKIDNGLLSFARMLRRPDSTPACGAIQALHVL
jgi:uncharacterized caspase-like protein